MERVNRGFCSSVGFEYELDCSRFRRGVQEICFRYLVGTRDKCFLGKPNRRRPFRPGHALLPRTARGMSGFWTRQVNRRSTAGQPRVNRGSSADCVPPSVQIRFRLFVLPKKRPGQCLRFAGGQEGGLSPGRIDPTASRPTQPRPPSPPRRAPPRPDRPVVCPGFGFDMFIRS